MLRSPSRPYVCWRCLSQAPRQGVIAPKPLPYSERISSHKISSSRSLSQSTLKHRVSSTNTPSANPRKRPSPQNGGTSSIRERLGAWAAANPELLKNFDLGESLESAIDDTTVNNMNRPQSSVSSALENLGLQSVGMAGSSEGPMHKSDYEVGVDSQQPGDLVELRSSNTRFPIFAVYLGFFGGRHHFFGSQGRWIMSMSFNSLFTVSNFATMAEIQPILAEMPPYNNTEDLLQAQQDDLGPSRATASVLLERMLAFKTETQSLYLKNMNNLDRARLLLSDPVRVKYLSLFEIAAILLPPSLMRKDGSFPPAALYAVHISLYREEIAFRPISPSSDCHRRDHLFEIFPQSFLEIINRVSTMVRNYWAAIDQLTDAPATQVLNRTPFGSFIDKARQVVMASRQNREWTKGGLRPTTEPSVVPQVEWSTSSWEIMSFLQWWSSYGLFEPGSRFCSYGSTILRALDLYPNSSLDQSTAWAFLQEAGVVPLWEVPSRYRIRFPETGIVKGGGLARSIPPNVEQSVRLDIAASQRFPLPEQTVYCIDGPSAVLIDDGISLEPTNQKDEFWVHIHAADPASGIKPHSDLSKYMELIPENIYLKGHFQAMLSDPSGGGPKGDMADLVKEYSLAPGKRALTFSAKVNTVGDILDYKVAPTTVEKVVYMDPQDVAKLCKEPRPPSTRAHQKLSVGQPPAETEQIINRTITPSSELHPFAQDELLVLYRLAEALKKKREERGAWPYFFPGSSVQVVFPSNAPEADAATTSEKTMVVPPDPYIKIESEEDSSCSVVGNLMVLAGQVAGKWCADRKIPVPYRRDTKSATNFDAALKYAKEVVYPQIFKGIEPSRDQRMQLSVLTGGVEISTTSGPHFFMGIDSYAKATSPLRRFSDLLVHWQIHAAMAYEHDNKRSIDPSKDNVDKILPYSKERMSNTISLLHMREKMARSLSRGDRDWTLMALSRAWRFEGTAPKKLRFVTTARSQSGLLGYLDMFHLHAVMPTVSLNKFALIRNVISGDEFDVEIEDVNAFTGSIYVSALEYYPKERKALPAKQNAVAAVAAA